MLKVLLALILAASSFIGVAPKAYAEDKPAVWLQISPVSNRVALVAGENNDYEMTVSNIGSEDFSYHVYAAPYSISDEDYNINFSNETNRTQITRWIKFYQDDGTLTDNFKSTIKKDEKQVVRYNIAVPEDIPAGGQYAAIFAESDSPEDKGMSSGIKTVSRVGLVVYGRTNGDTVDSAEITHYNIPGFMISGKVRAEAKIKNGGNTDFEVRDEFVVSTLFGKELYNKDKMYNVLPDTERKISHEWENSPFMGIFKVHYKVSALDKVEDKTKIVIIMPVFMLIIMLLLLTGFVIWIIILVRKRNERKSRLMV